MPSSKYTGVSWDKKAQKWESCVTYKKIRYNCGFYDNERDAAKARDKRILAFNMDKPLQILKRV